MSTPSAHGASSADPAELVALVARARREELLRAHRHRLRREDLEDCLGQAVLELLVGARGGQRFASRLHVAHVLEQRFLSRVLDRRRALRGRSPVQAALEGALPLGGPGERAVEVADPRADVPPLVDRRLALARVVRLAPLLTRDQRLVLASQVALGMDRAAFCARHGWSYEKYRKVAQRARARLRGLMEEAERSAGEVERSADARARLATPGACRARAVGGPAGRRELPRGGPRRVEVVGGVRAAAPVGVEVVAGVREAASLGAEVVSVSHCAAPVGTER